MKYAAALLLLILLAIITCNLAVIAISPRMEGVSIHAIDSYLSYQREPVVILERQLENVQTYSPSNADGFPIAFVFMVIGMGLLLFARYYEDILKVKTDYLKAKNRSASKPTKPMTMIQPLDPWAHLRPPARPPSPSLPPPTATPPADDGDRW